MTLSSLHSIASFLWVNPYDDISSAIPGSSLASVLWSLLLVLANYFVLVILVII